MPTNPPSASRPAIAARVTDAAASATVRIGRDRGRGAGVVVTDGRVATNAHNLRGHQVTVTFSDGRVAVGEVTAADVDGDLAVIAVDTTGARPIEWAEAAPGLGSPVWTVTAASWGGPRVTTGSVSATGRPFRGPGGRLVPASIEHTAPLPRGSSGSPLLDEAGLLVGLNTHRLGDGFYLAIPADADLRIRIDSLGAGTTPTRRRIGVALVAPHAAARLRAAVGLDPRDGLLVREVDADGPGAQAGIKRGDLLVEVDGRRLTSADDLFAALGGDAETLVISVVRGGDELTVEVRPAPADRG